MLVVGSGTSGFGGSLQGYAGRSTVNTGGAVSLASGEGTATTSGAITNRGINAGTGGLSGVLVFSSGSASSGNRAAQGGRCA